jgi:hypothetical protein
MSFSFQHSGNSLPVTLALDETEVRADCPTCERSGMDGEVRFPVAAEKTEATTPARCSRGHVVMVTWRREGAAEQEEPSEG